MLLRILLVIAIFFLTTACSGDNDDPSATPTVPSTPEPTTALEPTATPWPQLRLEPVPGTLITEGGAFLLDSETGAITRVGDRNAEFSPDGTKMASRFCCLGAGFIDILDLSTGRNVRHNTGDVTYLAWSPDSQQIAFAVNAPPDQAGVYIIGRDGSSSRKLTADGHFGVLVWLSADRLGYYIGGSPGEVGVRYFTISTNSGAVEELAETEPPTANDPRILLGDLSPSGAWVLYRHAEQSFVWNKTTEEVQDIGGLAARWAPEEDKLLVYTILRRSPSSNVGLRPSHEDKGQAGGCRALVAVDAEWPSDLRGLSLQCALRFRWRRGKSPHSTHRPDDGRYHAPDTSRRAIQL